MIAEVAIFVLFLMFAGGGHIQRLAFFEPSSKWPLVFKAMSLIMQYALSPFFLTLLSISLWPTALALRASGLVHTEGTPPF